MDGPSYSSNSSSPSQFHQIRYHPSDGASSSCASHFNSLTRSAPNDEPIQRSIKAPVYPSSIEITSPTRAYADMVLNPSSRSYSRYGNDRPMQEIGWDKGHFSPKENRPYMIRWKSGKKVDQRLMMVLETFYQEIYVKRQEFFKRIFPDGFNDFADVYKKIGAMLWGNSEQVKHQTMQRSLSFGSPRRNEYFSVKTPGILIVKPEQDGGGGGGGGQTSGAINPTTVSSKNPK